MKPPKSEIKYERVPKYEEWITGRIDEIEYDMNHKRLWKGEEKVGPAVRITLSLEGCKFPKKTPWFSFNYAEKSNLYKLFLTGLVEGAKPNMEFDLDALKGLEIKAMYTQNGDFDNLAMIRPLKAKVDAGAEPAVDPNEEAEPVEDEAQIPF